MPIKLGAKYSSRKIALVTREEHEIDNEQQCYLSNAYETYLSNVARSFRDRHKNCEFPVYSSAAYNCHGLTFACRRTAIDRSIDVRTILKDDCYEKIEKEDVKPGDIVLYVSNGDIEHSGIVIGFEELIPKIRSKWGVIGPEAIHFANDCPYDFSVHEFYRVKK